jgi:cyanophycinase-like exopeptidase
MVPFLRPFRSARGWLVLVGGSSGTWPPTEPIDRAAVELMRKRAPVAFVPAAGCPSDYGESFLETYARLGARDGYVVPVRDSASARDRENVRLLQRAGLIYFGGGDTRLLLAAMAGTPALDAVASAYEAGAVVVGMSAGAIALAAWGVSLDPAVGVLPGWGWLPDALVSVHHTSARGEALARAVRDHPDTIGIALPEHAALAVGPDGEVQEWGEPGIAITPGAEFDPAT